MAPTTPGLHHVTAIAGDPAENARFYVNTLGLRLVKRTVNHDDTGAYHLYFGDRKGTPGTNVTFFPWGTGGREGRFGAGQTQYTAYAIPRQSVGYWRERLESEDVDAAKTERFGETVLQFTDPDGIGLELVATDTTDSPAEPWADSSVPAEHQLRGFHAVTLAVADVDPTAAVLTDVLGYEREASDDAENRQRYRSAEGGPGSIVDLLEIDEERGQMGIGTVHHVAFAAVDVDEQEAFRQAFADHGLRATEVIDRKYFESIYCREPGGVLFEVATTGPGFTVDEDVDELGSTLALPDWLEDERTEIEEHLPAFQYPDVRTGRDDQ